MMNKGRIKNTALDYFFPSYCFSCNNPVKRGKVICDDCYNEIEFTADETCNACGMTEKQCQCNFSIFHFLNKLL